MNPCGDTAYQAAAMPEECTCGLCGEPARTHADGTPRKPYQHRYGPTTHDFHNVNDPGVVWHGGIGHKLLTLDGDGVECYRCGMVAEPDVWQELIPDCAGPDGGNDHHWQAGPDGIECAYGDASIGPSSSLSASERCERA